MLMLSSTSELAGIAAARTHKVWLEKAYLATPGDINGTCAWQLETLLRVEVQHDDYATARAARFYVENGKVHSLGGIWLQSGGAVRTCFCAELHLGRLASI